MRGLNKSLRLAKVFAHFVVRNVYFYKFLTADLVTQFFIKGNHVISGMQDDRSEAQFLNISFSKLNHFLANTIALQVICYANLSHAQGIIT